MTPPIETASVSFEELFDLQDVQTLQDQFAQATGVASIITDTDGVPITVPSNFTRLCRDIIRTSEKGCANCRKSDAIIGRHCLEGPIIRMCLSCGLWDAGAGITVGGRHIGNWLIGQVRDSTQTGEVKTDDMMRAYAREIGADEALFIEAFHEVPSMSRERFGQIAQVLFTMANQLSATAYQNILQARYISEQKRNEEEKSKLEDQLHQAQKMEAIGQLAGGVAHDFNNMLTIISGYSNLGLMKADPSSKFAHYFEEILKTAERSANLTHQLLAFARKQTISPKEMNLNEAASAMLEMLQRLIGEDIQLTWHAAANLWKIKMDPSQIDQILTNLCVNARDAIKDTGTITIETHNDAVDATFCEAHPEAAPGEYVRLSVSDDGSGMDGETLNHVFEPFYTTKELGKGTGLGLATVFGIIKQNNGFITVRSVLGRGTTFSIYIPRLAEARSPVSIVEREVTLQRGRETILLVEDEPAILNIAATMLEDQGYTVLAAETPHEALRLAREHADIDLLITDVVMPKMNGWDLAAKLLSTHPTMKRIFVSGYTSDIIAHHGVLDEGVQFIQKPFSLPQLATRVYEVLADSRK